MKKKALLNAAIIVAVLFSMSIMPVIQPPFTGAAPPPPASPTATLPPTEPDADQTPHAPPSPRVFPPEVEQAHAQQAIEAVLEKHLRYWGPRYQVAPVEVTVEGEWAHGVAQWQSEAKTLAGPIHILAHRLPDGTWQALMPSTEGLYLQWVDAVPESLVPSEESSQLRTQAIEADALRQPQATPAVPPAVMLPADREEPSEPVEPASGPVQPMPAPTSIASQLGYSSPAQAIEIALEQYQWRYNLTGPMILSELTVEGEWAYAVVHLQAGSGELLYMLAHRGSDEIWQVLSPDAGGLYLTWIDAMPSTLLSDSKKSQLLSEITEANSLWLSPATDVGLLSLVSIPYISQYQGQSTQNHDCGPASGAMVLQAYEKRPGGLTDQQWIVQVRSHSGNSSGNLNFPQLEAAISWYGVSSTEIPPTLSPAPDAQMQEMRNALAASKPVIALVHGATLGRGTNYGDHFVVVRGFSDDNQYVYVNDPDFRCLSGWLECGGEVAWSYSHFRQACYDAQYGPYGIIVGNGLGGDCPQSGGVILYKHANYDCGGEGEGSGYVIRSSTDWQNVPGSFNDQASSLRVPSGQSVRLYEHSDRNGASVCRTGDDNDFAGDRFDGGSIPLNDHVSSFEVFDNSDCGSGPPLSGNWNARYDQGSTCWWDTNCNMTPRCTENINGPELHKDWGSSAPCGNMNGDDWVGDFNATVNFPAGEYVFHLNHDDGVKLWLNGQNIQDRGGSGSGPVCNGQGGYYLNGDENLRVLLREQGGDARVHVTWSTDTNVCISVPDAPVLQSPSDGEVYDENVRIWLDWNSVANATEYYAEYWGGPAGTLNSGWQDITFWSIGFQWAGYTYSWHVKARNDAGESGWSDTWTFTVKPTAPHNLSAQIASCSEINLYWNDSSGNEEGYKIFRDGFYMGQVGANTTSYQDTGLNENTSYSYYVKSFRGSIESDASNTVNITTPFCPAPDPPTLVSPSDDATLPHDADITLDWNSSSGATEYYAHLWGGPSIDINSSWIGDTGWHIGQLWPGTYFWDVRARNQYGESDSSSTWSFTVAAPATIGPLVYDNHNVDDDDNGQSSGDGDGIVECGETVELYVTLRNLGDGTATGVNAIISTGDPYVTWLYNTDSAYPDIPGEGTGTNSNDFDFAVDPNAPDGHAIQFDLNIDSPNGGPWPDSFSIPVACPQPDLVPSQWGGWPYPIVPSSITGTTEVNTLYAGYLTYIDWGITNSGDADCGGNAYGNLYIDDTLLASYNFEDVQAGWTWAFFDWPSIVVDASGWHTLKFVADLDDLIVESNETNNTWERDFYWTPVAPYTDDMESGTNDWTATGLWHQVDASSPYPASHSGSHSWWYGQDSTGDYDTGAANSGDLTSPPVYIPSTGYYLRFWYRYETETQARDWDHRWVQISVDGGPFDDVLQLYDDPTDFWLQSQAIDLSGYAGHIIQVRFHFDTLDDMYNDYRGWYIDDFDISTTPPSSCGDSHEPNDTPAEATAIAYGQTLNADMCPGGDYDFYTFAGSAGDKVVVDIDAESDGSLLDSYIYLLESDGTSVLAENDDEILAEMHDSHLGYRLPYTGTYYIKVKAWNHPSAGSADHFYSIHLLTDDSNPSAEITSPGHNTWLDLNLQTITTNVSDNESGIRNVTFYWHDANWDSTSDWIVLENDHDPRDGWTYNLDTSSIPEQPQDCVVFIYAYDWAGNYAGYGSYHLGIDRTPPTVNVVGIQQMYGDAPFLDFWVHWWDCYDNLSGIASYDVQYRDGSAGTWTDLLINTVNTFYRFVGQDGHTYYFRVRARDHAGNLGGYAGGDGDVQHTVQICSTPPDGYETDNTYSKARWITVNGDSQTHSFHLEGDQDWVRFRATAGITYTLATTNTGGHADTVLYLYDTDGVTLITLNDDYPGIWPASQIEWLAPTNGKYYAKVEHRDTYAYGCTTVYGLSIAAQGQSPSQYKVFLPLVLREYPAPSSQKGR